MAIRIQGYAVCLKNSGYGASLAIRKLYPVIRDASAETENLIRIIDESGEDYLYPAEFLRPLDLPAGLQRALRKAS